MFDEVPTAVSFPELELKVLAFWKEHGIFPKSLKQREGGPRYVFYEGPPTANGLPGIHHVLARAMKDLFPRYKTMRGFYSERKGGWDTHGLPVDLEHAYRTYDTSYMETVWWILKQLWDKQLIYEGFKVVPYCPRDQTPLSS